MNKEIKNLKELFLSKIKLLNETLWDGNVSNKKVEEWLLNFQNCNERIQVLYLLTHFMYFGSFTTRELLKSMYRDLYRYKIVRKIREENSDTLDVNYIDQKFNEHLLRTRFLGMGNPSESGQHLLYFFRQENRLPKNLFINTHEIYTRTDSSGKDKSKTHKINDKEVSEYVFIDDFCGSGSQAIKYSKELLDGFKTKSLNASISYLMLFGTTEGKKNIKAKTKFDYVESVFEIDNTFKCFSPRSRYYSQNSKVINQNEAENISRKYGENLIKTICEKEGVSTSQLDICAKENAHGFKDGQLLIGFDHNTPDNTLPIVWYDEDELPWRPIFKRYNKKYDL